MAPAGLRSRSATSSGGRTDVRGERVCGQRLLHLRPVPLGARRSLDRASGSRRGSAVRAPSTAASRTAHGVTRVPGTNVFTVADRRNARLESYAPGGRYVAGLTLPPGTMPCNVDYYDRFALVACLRGPGEQHARPDLRVRGRQPGLGAQHRTGPRARRVHARPQRGRSASSTERTARNASSSSPTPGIRATSPSWSRWPNEVRQGATISSRSRVALSTTIVAPVIVDGAVHSGLPPALVE